MFVFWFSYKFYSRMLSECKINTYVLIFLTAEFMWSDKSFNPKTYKMTSEDSEETKKIVKYITLCMETYMQNNATIPTELSELMLSLLLDAAKNNILTPKLMSTYFNHLHYSMRSVGSIISEVKRQRYLKQFAAFQSSSLVRTLAVNSRLVQMIALSATERRIVLDHIKTVVDEDNEFSYWTTHLEVIELFYQMLDNDGVDFVSMDSTIRNITNINMIK